MTVSVSPIIGLGSVPEHNPRKRLELVDEVLFEIEYFGYLVSKKEIKDPKTWEYYTDRMHYFLNYMREEAQEIQKEIGEQNTESDRDARRHAEVIKGLVKYWTAMTGRY